MDDCYPSCLFGRVPWPPIRILEFVGRFRFAVPGRATKTESAGATAAVCYDLPAGRHLSQVELVAISWKDAGQSGQPLGGQSLHRGQPLPKIAGNVDEGRPLDCVTA